MIIKWVYLPNFVQIYAITSELWAINWIQDGGRRHLELLFYNAGPPTKPVCGPKLDLQILRWSSLYFSRYRDLKISQIWLKMPTWAPKNHVLGESWPLNFTFYHWDPQKALPCAETRVLSLHWLWSVLWCDLDATRREKKKKTRSKLKFVIFADPLPIFPHQPNFARRFVSRISFLVLSFRKIGWKCESSGGRVEFLAFPLTWHIAYSTAAMSNHTK